MREDILTQIQISVQRKIKEKGETAGPILAVYLFGSSLSEATYKNADVDLAFLLNEESYKADPFAATAPAFFIAAHVGLALQKETDVTVLNGSSLEIAYEVVTSGKCLFESDTEKRLEFESSIRGMYFDFKPFLDELRSRRLSRL